MKSKDEFKKRFENGEFDDMLKGVTSPEDVVKIANDLGYDLTVEDILSSELDDNMLSLVAGGKNDTKKYYNIYNETNSSVDNRTIHNGNGNIKQVK